MPALATRFAVAAGAAARPAATACLPGAPVLQPSAAARAAASAAASGRGTCLWCCPQRPSHHGSCSGRSGIRAGFQTRQEGHRRHRTHPAAAYLCDARVPLSAWAAAAGSPAWSAAAHRESDGIYAQCQGLCHVHSCFAIRGQWATRTGRHRRQRRRHAMFHLRH